MSRRAFLRTAAGLLVAAPAIVRAESIMRVRVVPSASTLDQATREALRLLESRLRRHDDLLDAAVYQAVLYGTGLERLVFRRTMPLRPRLTLPPDPS